MKNLLNQGSWANRISKCAFFFLLFAMGLARTGYGQNVSASSADGGIIMIEDIGFKQGDPVSGDNPMVSYSPLQAKVMVDWGSNPGLGCGLYNCQGTELQAKQNDQSQVQVLDVGGLPAGKYGILLHKQDGEVIKLEVILGQ